MGDKVAEDLGALSLSAGPTSNNSNASLPDLAVASPGEAKSPSPQTGTPSSSQPRRRVVTDFTFGRTLGEGSYSTVSLAVETSSGREFAIKVLDKRHIVKEKKTKYVTVEKDVLNKLSHPFVVRLYYTFQDTASLYFVLDLAPNGELLEWIKKLGSFDENCARFYTAEILVALQYVHSQNIIHRDVKPENILLDAKMHIKLTDFGTAKMLDQDLPEGAPVATSSHSFVGTAEYVSPELLVDKVTTAMSDLWAIGCILYQLLAGRPPFKGPNEYQTFQKITKLEYTIPPGFPKLAEDLVRRFLVHNPQERIGYGDKEYKEIKDHAFFEGIPWATLPQTQPPKLLPYLPPTPGHEELRGDESAPVKRTLTGTSMEHRDPFEEVSALPPPNAERLQKLRVQRETSKWAPFLLDNELIVMQGVIYKRKGLFAKKRQLLLTDYPRLIYIDEEKMVQKGEIPWSASLKPELKNKSNFFIHTPKRTYYMEDAGESEKWVAAIQKALDSRTSSKRRSVILTGKE